MSPDVSTLEAHTPARRKLPFRWWWLPLLIVGLLIVAGIPRGLRSPSTVSQITIVNQTKYTMDVDVTGGQRDGWMGLGPAEREGTTVVRDVIDQGDTWIFRFRSQGLVGGELQLSQAELKRSEWRVAIADEIGKRLAAEGAAPTPPPAYRR